MKESNPQGVSNSEFNTFWTICKELTIDLWDYYRLTVRRKNVTFRRNL